jgi:hypothetical protein
MVRLVTTDKKKPRLEVVEPRTRRRITPEEIETGLGAERSGIIPFGGSPMSAYAVRQELFRRLRSTGGRPALDGADIKPKIPMRHSQWKRLEDLARQVETESFHPTPAQLASVILGAGIEQFEPTPQAPDNTSSDTGRGGWAPERIAIRQLLTERAPPLVSLYDAAVKMLHDETFPARRYLIAHCIREIANSLPTYLGEGPTKQRRRMEYGELIKPIVEPWRSAGLPVGAETPPVALVGSERPDAGASVLVPITIVREISHLLDAYAEISGRRQRDAFLLFQALSEDQDEADASRLRPIASWWLKTCNWFVGRAHHSRRPENELTEEVDNVFVTQFESFERLLHTMVEPFLDIAKSLDEDLEQANL